jgi:hypothetical protein
LPNSSSSLAAGWAAELGKAAVDMVGEQLALKTQIYHAVI